VTRWQPGWVMAMTWDFPDDATSGTSAVSFALAARADRTLVRIEHDGLTEPAGYAAGWHRHLEYLAAHLDGTDKPFEDFWDGYDALQAQYAQLAEDSTRGSNNCSKLNTHLT
jgi:hypothetical protein